MMRTTCHYFSWKISDWYQSLELSQMKNKKILHLWFFIKVYFCILKVIFKINYAVFNKLPYEILIQKRQKYMLLVFSYCAVYNCTYIYMRNSMYNCICIHAGWQVNLIKSFNNQHFRNLKTTQINLSSDSA